MSDFEEKLNSILSSPESMQQVAQLAQMLSQQNDTDSQPPPTSSPTAPTSTAPPSSSQHQSTEVPDLSSLLGGIDMGTISRFLPLLQAMNSGSNDERTQLLYALKPFLKPERQNKIDRALRLAHLFHLGKTFFKGFGEHHV